MKSEMLKKSATTNTLPWKPVQKLIISLTADDSSTTEFEDDADVSNAMNENIRANELTWSGMSAEALRAFDNASPASIAMDSPSMAPCSPIDGENSLNAMNQADGDSSSTKDSTKSTDAFQMKLDEYLKQVRAKTDAVQDVMPMNGEQIAVRKPKPAATAQQTEQETATNVKQKTPVVSHKIASDIPIFPLSIFSSFFRCSFFEGGVPFANISATGVSSIDKPDENIGKTKGTEIISIETAEDAAKSANGQPNGGGHSVCQYSRHIEK